MTRSITDNPSNQPCPALFQLQTCVDQSGCPQPPLVPTYRQYGSTDFVLHDYTDAIFATSAPASSSYWQELLKGFEEAADNFHTAAKFSPVSTESGQILEQVQFLEWLKEKNDENIDAGMEPAFKILTLSMAAADHEAYGVPTDEINTRFSRVVGDIHDQCAEAPKGRCVISFIDQYNNQGVSRGRLTQSVGLDAAEPSPLTMHVVNEFVDNWNQNLDGKCGDLYNNPRVLVVSTDFPVGSNLDKKFNSAKLMFQGRYVMCSQTRVQVDKMALGNAQDASKRIQQYLETTNGPDGANVLTIFVAVTELLTPAIDAIKNYRSSLRDFMGRCNHRCGLVANYMGVITIDPLGQAEDVYVSPPKGAFVEYSVAQIGTNAFTNSHFRYNNPNNQNLHGNNGDYMTTNTPAYKMGSAKGFELHGTLYFGSEHCSTSGFANSTFHITSKLACVAREGIDTQAPVIGSVMYDGNSCASGATLNLYEDKYCKQPYSVHTLVVPTGQEVDTCVALPGGGTAGVSHSLKCTELQLQPIVSSATSSGPSVLATLAITTGLLFSR
tara:strand:+ start:1802 stop:3460 length:1659 start_codon:yes stop_codon:yes gene_type:complete